MDTIMVNRLGRIVTYWVKSWDLGNKTWRCFWMKPARPCGRPRANIQLLMMSLASDSRVCSLLLNAGRLPPNIFPDIQKWTFFLIPSPIITPTEALQYLWIIWISQEFYEMCKTKLNPDGILVTQAAGFGLDSSNLWWSNFELGNFSQNWRIYPLAKQT